MTTLAPTGWLDSRSTCDALGLSRTTLQSLKNQGILRPGVHYYRRGIGSRGALQWDVRACRQTLQERTASNPADVETFALS